jgi:hypothetical protein
VVGPAQQSTTWSNLALFPHEIRATRPTRLLHCEPFEIINVRNRTLAPVFVFGLRAPSTIFNARRLTDKTGAEYTGPNEPTDFTASYRIPFLPAATVKKPSGRVMAAVARGANGGKS